MVRWAWDQSSGDDRDELPADVFLSASPVAHYSPAGRSNGNSQALERPRQIAHTTIDPPTHLGHPINGMNNPLAAGAVLEIDPKDALTSIIDHIVRQGFHVVEEDPDMETRLRYPRIAKVTGGRGGSIAARTSMSDPFAQSVMEAASAASDRAFSEGALVLAPGMGGTLPLYLFTEVAGKPAIVVPVANHDNNQHAPDENLRIANLWYAIDLYAALMTMPKTAF